MAYTAKRHAERDSMQDFANRIIEQLELASSLGLDHVTRQNVRGLRITVWDVLGWLGSGMTERQILDENLSPRLIPRLTSLFPGLIPVRDVDLKRANEPGDLG